MQRFCFSKGHKKILLVKYSEMSRLVKEQVKAAAEELGLTFPGPEFDFLAMNAHQNCDAEVKALFARKDCATAVVGASDWLVHYFLQKMRAHLPEIPQLEAIGAFNTQWSQQPGMEFHSFSMNFREMWETVIDRYVKHDPSGFNEIIWVKPFLIESRQHVPLAI